METNDSMIIRKCVEADIARTGEFYDRTVEWLDCHVNYPRWIYRVYPSESSTAAITRAGGQYICLQDEKIVAAFALNDEPQGSYQKGQWQLELADGTYMVVHALAVDPDLQRQGLGSDIIRFCMNEAKREGYRAIRADIVPGNLPARRLFEKNGFTYAGDVNLELSIGDIPAFSLYELNW